MTYLKLRDLNLKDRIVLYRGPFNLPVNSQGEVVDDYRARRALPSMEYILKQGGKLVLASHLGRPKGNVVESLRMDSVGRTIEQLLRSQGFEDVSVKKLDGIIGDDIAQAVRRMTAREVILLENTRFYPEEENCDPEFSEKLASMVDVCVFDAPNDMHRRAASTYGVTHYLVSAAGFLMDEEITTLNRLLNPPEGSVLILGGAKVEGKFETIDGLAEKYHRIILGGAMANTFLAATGFGIGSSKVQPEYFERIKVLLQKYGHKILLPLDVIASDGTQSPIVKVEPNTGLEQSYEALDTGPATNYRNSDAIANATGWILWNGPFGKFEAGFVEGSRAIARAMSEYENETVVLGGDTYSVTKMLNNFRFSHILIGGGSSLIFLEKQGDTSSLHGLKGLVESYQRLLQGVYERGRELVR